MIEEKITKKLVKNLIEEEADKKYSHLLRKFHHDYLTYEVYKVIEYHEIFKLFKKLANVFKYIAFNRASVECTQPYDNLKFLKFNFRLQNNELLVISTCSYINENDDDLLVLFKEESYKNSFQMWVDLKNFNAFYQQKIVGIVRERDGIIFRVDNLISLYFYYIKDSINNKTEKRKMYGKVLDIDFNAHCLKCEFDNDITGEKEVGFYQLERINKE